LAGAFSSTSGAVWAALFAIVALLNAELVWRAIVWKKSYLGT